MGEFTKRIAVDSDDAREVANDSALHLNDASIQMGRHPGNNKVQNCGYRFNAVTIAQGTTITSAKLTLTAAGDSTAEPTLIIDGEDADDAATFSTWANWDARVHTTATATWDPPNTTTNEEIDTPEIKTIVQEIVDRDGWSSGNDMVIFIYDNGSNLEWLNVVAYDGTAGKAALLTINTSTAYSLVMAVGTFTMTGVAAGLTSTRTLLMAVGTFTMTGVAAIFAYGRALVASVGAFTLTGIDAAFIYARTLVMAVGAFTLTGVAATFKVTRKLVMAVGTFILTGVSQRFIFNNWDNPSKNSTSYTNQSKTSTSWTDDSSSSSSWTNQNKN